jgi:hypothetical protein
MMGPRVLVATLVITLLAPGLAFLIYIVVQALLGKADSPPRQRPPPDSSDAPPSNGSGDRVE